MDAPELLSTTGPVRGSITSAVVTVTLFLETLGVMAKLVGAETLTNSSSVVYRMCSGSLKVLTSGCELDIGTAADASIMAVTI
jgi:hypothetical protein